MNPTEFFEGNYLIMAKAIQANDLENIRFYSKNVDLNKFGKKNMSLLIWAIINDKEDAVRELLKLGANPNLIDSDGMQPVGFACSLSDDNKYLKLLLEKGGDPNSRFNNYKYATINACMNKYWKNLDILLAFKANLELNDYDGDTILLICVILKDFDIALYLIKKGSDVRVNKDDIASYIQETEVHSEGLFEQQVEIKKILVNRGVTFPYIRKYERRYQALREKWYSTIEGNIWENKIMNIAKDPRGVGKVWVEAKREENKAFKSWMLANNIAEPPQIDELKKYE